MRHFYIIIGFRGIKQYQKKKYACIVISGLNSIKRSDTFITSFQELDSIKKSVEPELPRYGGSNDINENTMREPSQQDDLNALFISVVILYDRHE
jgi:hypothetical protein